MRFLMLFLHAMAGLLFWGCNSQGAVKTQTVSSTPAALEQPGAISPDTAVLKVSAYLIYEDGSLSSFDVLNDKTKALWNTIIGAGDAEKPSTMTKVRLLGALKGLRVKIINGKEKVVDQSLPDRVGEIEFILKNTGCQMVEVRVTKKARTVYEGNIPFQCGE